MLSSIRDSIAEFIDYCTTGTLDACMSDDDNAVNVYHAAVLLLKRMSLLCKDAKHHFAVIKYYEMAQKAVEEENYNRLKVLNRSVLTVLKSHGIKEVFDEHFLDDEDRRKIVEVFEEDVKRHTVPYTEDNADVSWRVMLKIAWCAERGSRRDVPVIHPTEYDIINNRLLLHPVVYYFKDDIEHLGCKLMFEEFKGREDLLYKSRSDIKRENDAKGIPNEPDGYWDDKIGRYVYGEEPNTITFEEVCELMEIEMTPSEMKLFFELNAITVWEWYDMYLGRNGIAPNAKPQTQTSGGLEERDEREGVG